MILITTKKNTCQVITLGASVLRSRKIVAMLDNRKGMYAHPLIEMCSASNNDPIIAPHSEICSMIVFSVFVVNSIMKIREAVQEHMVTHLLALCKRELNLSEIPPISLVDEPTVGGDHSFGVFDGTIKVVSKGRHPVDVMRTLAHELVHHQQRMNGDELDGSDGSDTENEANAIAGEIMRKFGKMYPQYFVDTLP